MAQAKSAMKSMTGFASAEGQLGEHSWSWELRSVNGRGLDLRIRVPDWIEGLEAALRKKLGAALGRGNVTLNLRLSRNETGGRVAVNQEMLSAVLAALGQVEEAAMAQGQSLAPATGADILALRGVLDSNEGASDAETIAALRAEVLKGFEPLLASFIETRAAEGAEMAQILDGHLNDISELTEAASAAAEARRPAAEAAFRAALQRVMDETSEIGEERLAQELAILAVKADVTEEIGRLRSHVAAGRDLMKSKEPVGRRLDFLMQEFNREANTLCSKSQDAALTAIGLDLKTKIDQLREQVQNVE